MNQRIVISTASAVVNHHVDVRTDIVHGEIHGEIEQAPLSRSQLINIYIGENSYARIQPAADTFIHFRLCLGDIAEGYVHQWASLMAGDKTFKSKTGNKLMPRQANDTL